MASSQQGGKRHNEGSQIDDDITEPKKKKQDTSSQKRVSSLQHTPVSIIATKRANERPHTDGEIAWFIEAFVNGEVKDYQMTAWLMASCIHGLNNEETAALTNAMVKSGTVLDWSDMEGVTVDKHSSGGVGDKISLILAPLVASFPGVKVPMMAGRGLGHTGGTIDKLESIPGFRTHLDGKEFRRVVDEVGAAIVSPGSDMAIADKKMYALRDVTSTVTCLGLMTSSIMSKKIAENPQSLVLDVKCGLGSLLKETDDSIALAKRMIASGERCGKQTTAFVTRMDDPIGRAVGNWLEVLECIEVMKSGRGPRDLVGLSIIESGQMLLQAGVTKSLEDAVQMAHENLVNGKAFAKFKEMVIAQGGEIQWIESPEKYPPTKFKGDVKATSNGFISEIDSTEVGLTGIVIRAGRRTSEDTIDFSAGMHFHKKIGDRVKVGDVMATIYSEEESTLEVAIERVGNAYKYNSSPPDTASKLISHVVTKDGATDFDVSFLDDILPP